MSIALEDRIRRAVALARRRGSVWASDRVVDALAREEDRREPMGFVALTSASAVVFMPDCVDTTGNAEGDPVTTTLPLFAVLDDDGSLTPRLAVADASGVVTVVCRRGRIDLADGTFVVVEVEDGISGREVQHEFGVPMFADERLTAF